MDDVRARLPLLHEACALLALAMSGQDKPHSQLHWLAHRASGGSRVDEGPRRCAKGGARRGCPIIRKHSFACPSFEGPWLAPWGSTKPL